MKNMRKELTKMEGINVSKEYVEKGHLLNEDELEDFIRELPKCKAEFLASLFNE